MHQRRPGLLWTRSSRASNASGLESLAVTATIGAKTLYSHTDRLTYGTNDAPQVSCSIAVQGVHFINEGDRAERVYPVALSLLCPVETNGTVAVEWNGNDGARFWADADATTEIFLPTNIPVGSVMRTGGESMGASKCLLRNKCRRWS